MWRKSVRGEGYRNTPLANVCTQAKLVRAWGERARLHLGKPQLAIEERVSIDYRPDVVCFPIQLAVQNVRP